MLIDGNSEKYFFWDTLLIYYGLKSDDTTIDEWTPRIAMNCSEYLRKVRRRPLQSLFSQVFNVSYNLHKLKPECLSECVLKYMYFLVPEKSCSADAAVLYCVPSVCPNDPWPHFQ